MKSGKAIFMFLLIVALPVAAQLGQSGATSRSTRLREESDRQIAAARERQYDRIVSDFIKYDIGRIRDPQQVREVLRRYNKLRGDDSVPALVRGLNYSTGLRASCPITALSSRLNSILRRSKDPEVGLFVMRNLQDGNAGAYTYHVRRVTKSAEQQYLRLKKEETARSQLEHRMNEENQRLSFNPNRSLEDVGSSGRNTSASNSYLDAALGALGRRKSTSPRKVSPSKQERERPKQLGTVEPKRAPPRTQGSTRNPNIRTMSANDLIDTLKQPTQAVMDELYKRSMTGEKAELLKNSDRIVAVISSRDVQVRDRAIRIVGLLRMESAIPALIDRLSDGDKSVRSSAATALTRITRQLFGPSDRATEAERATAIERWKEWHARTRKKP